MRGFRLGLGFRKPFEDGARGQVDDSPRGQPPAGVFAPAILERKPAYHRRMSGGNGAGIKAKNARRPRIASCVALGAAACAFVPDPPVQPDVPASAFKTLRPEPAEAIKSPSLIAFGLLRAGLPRADRASNRYREPSLQANISTGFTLHVFHDSVTVPRPIGQHQQDMEIRGLEHISIWIICTILIVVKPPGTPWRLPRQLNGVPGVY